MLFSMLKLAERVEGEFARTKGLPHEHKSSPGCRAMIARSSCSPRSPTSGGTGP